MTLLFSLNNGYLSLEGDNKLTYGNIGLFHPDLFRHHSVKFTEFSPLLKKAIEEVRITGEVYDGTWVNVGTPGNLE